MCKKLVYKTGRILSYRNLAKECKMVSAIDNTYVIPKNFQQNEDYGNSDNIKANPFMNSFFICWNSEKCRWLEFRSLRCLCYCLAGPFSTTQKDKNPKLFFFFFFGGQSLYQSIPHWAKFCVNSIDSSFVKYTVEPVNLGKLTLLKVTFLSVCLPKK